jgi:TetR/AcrR family transcriptional regulator, mexCD-oprJ operon repressor
MGVPARQSRRDKAGAVPPLQQRVSGAILEAAARVLAAQGPETSVGEIAAAAGVARATVYRYFPSRQALLDDLARLAVARAGERLESAHVHQVGAAEGVARAVRALLDVEDLFLVLARERVRPDPETYDRLLLGPLRRLVHAGQRSGQLRADLPPSWLSESLVGLVVAVLAARPAHGREDTAASIASLFLDGTRTRPSGVRASHRS